MKRLIVVRHAKSSWDDPALADIERPLNERGERDAPAMAKRLKERSVHPQRMITSPARRAAATCQEFSKVLGVPRTSIQTIKSVYHAGPDTLFDVLRQTRDIKGEDLIILFGHNPGLTDFVNELLNEDIDNVPTTGVVACTLNISHWTDIRPGCGVLDYFDYPKRK